jgi:hypothetical protein
MGISFLGHSPNFEIWVFNVNGRELVARNFSTPSPLQLKFAGFFDKYSGSAPLIKTSGFNITDSTDKVIVWTWAGKQYTSWWKAESDDIDDPDANTTLLFGPPVPYSGPPVAPVGTTVSNKSKEDREIAEAAAAAAVQPAASMQITPAAQLSTAAPEIQYPMPVTSGPVITGNAVNMSVVNSGIASPAVIQAQQSQEAAISVGLVSEFKDSIDNANRALAVSEAQRKVDINALNSARVEIEAAKQMLAQAQAKATRDQELLLAQMAEKVQEMQERAEVQINIARQMMAAQQTPPPTPVSTGTIPSPVVTTPTAPTAPASTSQTDWVKLGLQLGAAYLLIA